jgi:predicted nucleotidyltransferase
MLDPSLVARLKEVAARAFAGRSVAAAYVHGSRASGRPRPTSDLDIAYRMIASAGRTVLPLSDELAVAGVMSDAIGLEADLGSLGDAPLDVRGRILEEGCRIYDGAPEERVAFERDTLSRYHDYKAEFLAMHELRLKTLASRGS